MKIILDTHAFIWWDSDISQLSPTALQLCQDPANTLLLSAASVWEMQIKQQLGKLKLKLPLREIVQTQQECQWHSCSPCAACACAAAGTAPAASSRSL